MTNLPGGVVDGALPEVQGSEHRRFLRADIPVGGENGALKWNIPEGAGSWWWRGLWGAASA